MPGLLAKALLLSIELNFALEQIRPTVNSPCQRAVCPVGIDRTSRWLTALLIAGCMRCLKAAVPYTSYKSVNSVLVAINPWHIP